MNLRVRETHYDDEGPPDPDGRPVFVYRYVLFEFSGDGSERLIARAYDDEPGAAHFLRLEGNQHREIVAADFARPLFLEAMAYLRKAGRPSLTWLSVESGGYVVVPTA